MSADQCAYVPDGRLRCAAGATFLVSVTVGDGHHKRVCSRHLAGACRNLSAISAVVVVAVLG